MCVYGGPLNWVDKIQDSCLTHSWKWNVKFTWSTWKEWEWKCEFWGMTSVFPLYYVSGTLKFTRLGLKCLTSLGMKRFLFGNGSKICPGIVWYGVEGSSFMLACRHVKHSFLVCVTVQDCLPLAYHFSLELEMTFKRLIYVNITYFLEYTRRTCIFLLYAH